jgi:hypothetical protein
MFAHLLSGRSLLRCLLGLGSLWLNLDIIFWINENPINHITFAGDFLMTFFGFFGEAAFFGFAALGFLGLFGFFGEAK